MYAKIFSQIFDSSIAVNYEVRHVFEDLLKLCDSEGVVDMTLEAISRRTNVPIEKVTFGVEELCKPDENSRSRQHEGRRLIPLDSNRSWGWIVVNYEHYRKILNEESRRAYFRDAKRKQRGSAGKRAKASTTSGPLPGETAAVRAQDNGHLDENFEPVKENVPQYTKHHERPSNRALSDVPDGTEGSERILQTMQKSENEVVAPEPPIAAGSADENERAKLRACVSKAREANPSTVPLREEGGNAPPRSSEAVGSGLAVPRTSPATPPPASSVTPVAPEPLRIVRPT